MLLSSCGSDSSVTVEEIELTVTDEKADFLFIHKEDADQSVIDALNGLSKVFCERENIEKISVRDDTYKENSDKVEILVGATNRSASQNVMAELRDREYAIGVFEGKFVIAGADNDSTVDAINHLYIHYDDFIKEGKLSSKNNYTLKYDYKYDNIKAGDNDIKAYTVTYPDPGGTYAEKESIEKYAAQRLSEKISALSGAILPVENEKLSEAKLKLIIEKSDKKDSYSIRTKGENIIISADSFYSFAKAFDALLENEKIPADFSADKSELLKETKNDEFVYVSYLEDKVYGKSPVKSLKIGDTDISEFRIIYHEYGKSYSGYGMNEIYAAQQLQRYLKYATGIELTLDTDASKASKHEILIGKTDRTKEELTDYTTEEYIIKTEGDNLIIAGGEQRGTLYGVYSFLEDYVGCRFFSEDCEVIYKAEEIIIPSDINKCFSPTLEYRDIDEKIYQGGEVAAKRKINSSFCRAMTYYQGSSVDFAGSAFVHTMDTVYDIAPQSKQPCFSSEENYQIVLEKSRTILKSNPNAEILSVTQNDNNNYCTCKDCSLVYQEEESYAAPLIRFVNRLAEELYDEYPNIKIETLAYMFSTEAPKITKPHENVIIELCALDMCCADPLSDLGCVDNKRFREQIEDWSGLADNLYIWYYVIEFTRNSKDAPFMNFDALYENYTYFYKNGVTGVFNQACDNRESEEFGALRAYLLSKLMWDPNMTREEFDLARDEFIKAYYGEAADVIEEYFHLMNRFAKGRHFEQYAAVTGVLDINRFNVISDELSVWMDAVGKFDYELDYTKTHINRLRKGFNNFNQVAAKMK